MATYRVNLLVTIDDDDERDVWDIVPDALMDVVDDVDMISVDEV